MWLSQKRDRVVTGVLKSHHLERRNQEPMQADLAGVNVVESDMRWHGKSATGGVPSLHYRRSSRSAVLELDPAIDKPRRLSKGSRCRLQLHTD